MSWLPWWACLEIELTLYRVVHIVHAYDDTKTENHEKFGSRFEEG